MDTKLTIDEIELAIVNSGLFKYIEQLNKYES